MVKRFVLLVLPIVAIAAMSVPALANPNLTGKWNFEQSSVNGISSGVLTLTQTGDAFVGTTSLGTSVTGKFCTPPGEKKSPCVALQINGTWRDKTGEVGWLTVFVTPNGHSFNGSWGYHGRKENGTYVANKILPPIKITTAGNWSVTAVTGPTLFQGPMSCTESGPTSVCKLGPGTLNGKFRTKDKVRYKWTSKSQNGWFSFWFNDDGQSFNGIWGYGEASETSPVIGRVVGQRQGPPARK